MSSRNLESHRSHPSDSANFRMLEGHHILVVEDDQYQCDGIVGCLNDAGAVVVGPVGTVKDAMKLADTDGITVAILDIGLADGLSFELAQHLNRTGIPLLFVTGYDCRSIPPELTGMGCLEKPFAEHDLLQATLRAAGGAA